MFVSAATNLVPGETGFLEDVFVADLDTGAITAESRTPTGASVEQIQPRSVDQRRRHPR